MQPRYWIGFDAGEIETAICVIDNFGDTIIETTVFTETSAILIALNRLPRSQVEAIVMEAAIGRHIARDLKGLGFPIAMLSTHKTKPLLAVRQHKTDTNDARGLAELAKLGHPALIPVHLKSQECQQMRSHLVMRNQMMEQKINLQNAMRTLLQENGIARKLPHAKTFYADLEALLAPIPAALAKEVREQIVPLEQILAGIRSYLLTAEKRLVKSCNSNPITSEFLRIPGVGPICAMSFYTAIDDPFRFRKTADVGAYFGLVPRVKQSGTLLHKSRITKAGNRLTRSHLFMAAGVVLSYDKNSALREWGLAIAARSGHSKARIAVARKLAITMLSIWKSGEPYRPYPSRPFRLEGGQIETPTTCLELLTQDRVVALDLPIAQ